MIRFTIEHDPFKVTAQQKRVSTLNGAPRFYYPERLKEAYNVYLNDVWPYRPEEPIEGPVALIVTFWFYTKDKKKWNTAKITRPDTDNLIKGFKDVLTAAGFWKDDAQIFQETVVKNWSDRGHIDVMILSMDQAKKEAEALRKEIDEGGYLWKKKS